MIWASAQTTFTESAAAYGLNLGGTKDGGHAWSDYDNDGDIDVLVLRNSVGQRNYLMRNNGNGTFTNVQTTLAPGMLNERAERQAAWGDLNGDGRPDFMMNSWGSSPSDVALQIFIQNANGTFGNGIGGTAPISVGENATATITINDLNVEGAGFFDFEGDGDLDIFFDSHQYGIELLRNNYIDHVTHTVANPTPAGFFTHITPGNGPGVVEFGLNQFATDGDYGSAADVNDDGWVDIFMRKRDENDFFLNQGGTFTNGSDLAQADNDNKGGNGLWDLDNDGDLDAVWTENGFTQIFRNDGPGMWTALGAVVFPGLPQPPNANDTTSSAVIDALAGGDIDNDGDIDILFVGDSRSYLYINQLNSPTPAPGQIGSGAAMTFTLDAETFNSRNGEGTTMIDIDDDGDLDIYMNISGRNQLFINDLPAANRVNHLIIDVTEDRDANGMTGVLPERVAIGTNVLIRDCDGNIISGLRQVNGVYGHGTQSPEQVHIGLPLGENETYTVEVRYPNFYDPVDGFKRLIGTIIAMPSTIPGTNHYTINASQAEASENINAPEAVNDEVIVSMGTTVSVQISLFDNDSEPDGEDFFISSLVQPAIGTVVIDDADLGLVTYTYSASSLFPGTTFDYTISDSPITVCPALGKIDTATVTIFEPCVDPTGMDTDGDGINNVCDLDDDNDGILDTVEHPKTVLWVTNGTPGIDEQNTINKLTALGYTVTVVDDNVGGNANDFAVTFLFEEIDSGTAYANVSNLTTTSNGVITSEPALHDELFGAALGGNNATNFVNIIDNLHPITSGLSIGNYDIGDGAYHGNGLTTGTVLAEHPNGEGSLVYWEAGDAMEVGIAPGRRAIVPFTNNNGGFNENGEDLLVNAILWSWALDSDRDGINDDLDLDSDDDGIPDNVEAQTTLAYLPPNNDNILTYASNLGVNSAYLGGITPINTDSTDEPDYLDFNSDNVGHIDTTEAGIALAGVDADNDGLDDGIDTDLTGYNDPGGTIDDPLDPAIQLLDLDNDAAIGGDVDFRDATDNRPDNDLDGIVDALDFDDDNDGILDTDEGCGNLIINPSFEQQDFSNTTTFPNGFTGSEGTFIGASFNTNTLAGWTYTQNLDGWVGGQSPSWNPTITYADAYHGNQFIDVMGNNIHSGGINNRLSQVINTEVGQTYVLSFFWGEDVGHLSLGPVSLDVDIIDSGNVHLIDETITSAAQGRINNVSGPKRWFYYENSFVATTALTTLEFFSIPDTFANGAALDLVSIIKAVNCRDTDNDGTIDAFDLDSDNDGIYDAVEAGHEQQHTNGEVNGPVGSDGVPNAVQDLPNEEVVNYALDDSDNDGMIDAIELDADNDGCNDVLEAGFTDGNDDGLLGPNPVNVDANGLVTSGSDGYTTPRDANLNIAYDFQEAGIAPSISFQPVDITLCPGCSGTLNVTSSNSDNYQWQYFNGSTWVDLTNSGIYSGTNTNTLVLTQVTPTQNGNQYRVLISSSTYVCVNIISSTVILNVNVNTVITNRRITYRAKKN